MSVVGVDFGTLNTVIAVARNRGVDVITNEVSNRATPTLVGFGPKSRYIGEAAKTQEISNLKNTVGSLKRLAGRSLNDPDIQIEQDYVSAKLVDVAGQVGAEVQYLGKKDTFTSTQLTAMFLNKIKATASAELKLPVSDIVLSVPPWFTDAQRRSIIDASEVAGLKLLRLINDTTAVALGYGITKLDLPTAEEKPRRVCFVDIGHSTYSCSIVEFRKGELSVKATTWDRHFGGRNFDKALVDHFAKEFKEKYKIDIYTNPKALARVSAASEKMKKVLSANAQAPISIESLMNDVDVSGMMKRDEMEVLLKPLLERAIIPMEHALADAKLKIEDIDAVEMVGGCTRVPSLKDAIGKFFGKPLSYTLNQDEAVARGCAFSCAILSPVFRVRDFSIHDIVSYPIEFKWEKTPDIPDEDTSLTVFNKGNAMPSTKILTFYRKHPFDLEAQYAKPEQLPGKMNPWIGRFTVKGVKADKEFMICKLKARFNVHGVLNVDSGYHVEDVEVEEPIPEEKEGEKKDGEKKDGEKKDGDVRSSYPIPYASDVVDEEKHSASTAESLFARAKGAADSFTTDLKRKFTEGTASLTSDRKQAMDTDGTNGADAKPKTRKVKKQVRKGDLPIVSGTASLDQQTKDAATDKEGMMFMEDKLVIDTEDKKNELESYIYEMRGKVDEVYAEFASEEEKEKLRAKLTQSEDWLYDEGDDATKAVYVSKMEDIRFVAGPIVQRYQDKLEEERQARLKIEEERAAKVRAEVEAKRKVEEEARKAAGGGEAGAEKAEGGVSANEAAANAESGTVADVDMKDGAGGAGGADTEMKDAANAKGGEGQKGDVQDVD